MLRQCADAHAQRPATVELGDLSGADDADKSRCQAALRRHQPLGRFGQLDDMPGGRHVLRQVEIMDRGAMRGIGNSDVEVIGQTGQHRVDIAKPGGKTVHIGDVGYLRVERQRLARSSDVEPGDLESGFMQQQRCQLADLSQTQNRNFLHLVILRKLRQPTTSARWSSIPIDTTRGDWACRDTKSALPDRPRHSMPISDCATAPPSVVPGPSTIR